MLTLPGSSLLEVGVRKEAVGKPWKLIITWAAHDAYPGTPVYVELHIMDEYPREVHWADSVPRAVDWALRFIDGRGFSFWCDVDMHQRLDHKHITLHPRPKAPGESESHAQPPNPTPEEPTPGS